MSDEALRRAQRSPDEFVRYAIERQRHQPLDVPRVAAVQVEWYENLGNRPYFKVAMDNLPTMDHLRLRLRYEYHYPMFYAELGDMQRGSYEPSRSNHALPQ